MRGDGTGELPGEAVWQLFRALQHAGDLSVAATEGGGAADEGAAAGEHTLLGDAGHERQGTRVRFALRMAGCRILEARYRAFGCPYTLAACEWLARQLQGRKLGAPAATGLAQALGGPLDWARTLQIPAARLGRLLVIEDALQAALDPRRTKGA
jgi:hypothetical protein